MKVFLACWFDRHIDPLFEVFEFLGDAQDCLEQWMEMREYEYIRSWAPPTDGELLDEFDYVWKSPQWIFYVTAKMDDGPHGYVLLREIR